jgi:flavin-binding protein dodecin
MPNHVYKTIELTGSSPKGVEEAIRNAVAKASQTLHNLRWFQVVETRGEIEKGKVAHWQVTMKVGFTLD